MVARLEGKVDGRDVAFVRKHGDVWEAIVPADLDGTYIVELTAWDEAETTASSSSGCSCLTAPASART